MNLFELSLKLKGFPIKEAKVALKNIQNKTEANYLDYLEASRHSILQFHLKHNSFYKLKTDGIAITNWNSVPILTKKDLQQPLQNRLSKGFTQNNCYVNKTSGSSGDPFIFAKDKFCHALSWAGFIERYSWYAINFKTSKQARFYGIPLDKKGYYKERLKDLLSNRFRFSVFDLSTAQLEKNLEKFKTTNFNYINGYTSAIVQFAKYLEQKQVVLNLVCPTLKACIVTSEMLFADDKLLLEKQFGVPIINEYGSAELGLIAFQNPNNLWQVNSDDLYVEVVDNNNAILPYGETGRLVITSLYNKAHPFIRYDIGDIGALDEQSTPQKPILKNLIGRTSDMATLPSGKKAAGLTFYYVTKSIIEDGSTVKEFVIEQLNLETFKVIYVATKALSEEKKVLICNKIDTYLEPNLTVLFEKKDIIKRSKSGKLKQFTSFVK